MDGAPRQMNNPSRVPSTLTAIDGPQEGEARVIHPVGILVGRAVEESPMNPFQREPEVFEVPQDGTYIDVDGNPFAFAKGHRLSLGRASRFPDFNVAAPDARNARQEPAPENRMEPSPENRSAKSSKKDDADGAQGESK